MLVLIRQSDKPAAAPAFQSRSHALKPKHPDIPEEPPKTMNRNNTLAILATWLALTVAPLQTIRSADGPAPRQGSEVISGSVSSSETGNMLQGAVINIPSLNRQVVTDNAGRFLISGLPKGSLELTVSYTGLKEERRTVPIDADSSIALTFVLSPADVVLLEKFTVPAEREGSALAITNQRNAGNLKNVVAMDAYGNLPHMSMGEVMIRLPGVTGVYDAEGNVTGVRVRGMPNDMTRVNIDGNPVVGPGGARIVDMQDFTGASFEQLELIKGQTPDKSADSIGGSINLKTRSSLSMREKRRISYNVSGRWAPPFFYHPKERREHPFQPLLRLAYQENFDRFGGTRNLGVSLSVFYDEIVNSGASEYYDRQNTTASPAYIWDYRSVMQIVNRHVTSANLRFDYRLSPASNFFFSALYNQGDEPSIDRSQLRAFTNQVVATIGADGRPTGTGGILPGYTEQRTQVRAVAASTLELNNYHLSYYSKSPSVNLGGEHKLGQWEFDYNASGATTGIVSGSGKGPVGGQLVMQAPNLGWIIEKNDDTNPRFTQTEGRDIYDTASYTGLVQHTRRRTNTRRSVLNATANAAWRPALPHAPLLKSGLVFREQKDDIKIDNARQWNRVPGAPPLPNVPLYVTPFDERQGGRLPVVDPRATNPQLANPALWQEDLYYWQSQMFSARKKATESIVAGYFLGQAKVERLALLGGVRGERTELTGSGFVRRRQATVGQIPDPVQRAQYDWNNPASNKGSYTRWFPSIHLTYDVTENLKGRASWSTSFGRPPFGSLVPSATVSDAAQTVTVNNPALGPQYAKNIDVALEYYFLPAGFVSAGYFKKDIADYIVTTEVGIVGSGPNNGFAGDYLGYAIFSRANAGSAEVEGWEFDYRQRFVFLPGILKGLELAGNYTHLKTKGDFGGSSVQGTSEVAGFVPRAGNLSLSYRYLRFGTRILFNYASNYLLTYNAAASARIYLQERKTVNWGLSYRWRPSATFTLDVINVFGERRKDYRYLPSRTRQTYLPGQLITFGVSGQF
ncbi:MAG: TonB-dependent receptor [Verrucomicrobia bacterium]|nr:TonB-dependent receptor [Verrucomicrobiota bacterium]